MTITTATRLLSGAALLLTLVAAVRSRGDSAPSAPIAASTSARGHARLSQRIADDSLAEATDFTISNDPFRLANSPPDVRFDLRSDGRDAGGGSPPPIRPTLTLKAIVGGPPWNAVIDGIPGQPAGTVTASGQRFDKLLVRAVTRDSVIVQGPDTVWVLSFRRRS